MCVVFVGFLVPFALLLLLPCIGSLLFLRIALAGRTRLTGLPSLRPGFSFVYVDKSIVGPHLLFIEAFHGGVADTQNFLFLLFSLQFATIQKHPVLIFNTPLLLFAIHRPNAW